MNTVSFILAVALSTVVTLVIAALIAAIAFYRWRNTELMKGITDFISRNWKLEQEIKQLKKNK